MLINLNSEIIALFAKIFEILIVLLFLVYSLLTVREVGLMNATIVTSFAPFVKIAAVIQLAIGILVLLIILVR